ncbi:MAG: hypothetical protein ACK2UK_20170, partial [Candidatus Promineifilaceae bacterium]
MSQGPTTISNSLFENNSGGSAGALFLLGETVKATITGSTLQNNATSSSEYGYGGAIAAWFGADVTISDSRLLHNQARYGGALYNESKDADIVLDEGTIVAENAATLSGGGIFNSYGKLTLTGITLKDNSAAEDGGGLEVGWSGSASLTDVTLEGNTAGADGGGANSSGGAATFLRTTFIHNDAGSNGGGFSLSQLGTALLTESLMTENSANQGGGFSNSNATLTLQQSTVSHNSAVANGGGIFNKGV